MTKKQQVREKQLLEGYRPNAADQYPTEKNEFDDYYRSDTALGDQYVMQENEEPQRPWDDDQDDEEELKDQAFIDDEQDY